MSSTGMRSRNGCITCKSKRQKCDETRPHCMRCQRAGLSCGGYAKVPLRWRNAKYNNPSKHATKTGSSESGHRAKHAASPKESNQSNRLSFGADNWQEVITADTPSSHSSVTSSAESQAALKGQLPAITGSAPAAEESLIMDTFDCGIDLGLLEANYAEAQLQDNHEGAVTELSLEPYSLFGPWMTQNCFEQIGPNLSSLGVPNPMQLVPSGPPPGMLMIHFDQQTCGILSIKDGPSENPWRSLIWPLSKEYNVVDHALSCMTAFHGSYDMPSLYDQGAEDMKKSTKCLTSGKDDLPFIPALASLIALVFAEGWKSPKATSNKYLCDARQLITTRLPREKGNSESTAQNAMRLKYLVTAFVYVHVLAAITRRKDEDVCPLPTQILSLLDPTTTGVINEIDPLLGCAASLFPLVDRVVAVAHRARQRKRNSLTMVSQASDLYLELQQWQAPSINMLQCFNESQYGLQQAIQTAEALRYTTLLHLHQAIPEIPSETSEELARKVLLKLASTPSKGRITNLQIFPLLAASCELVEEEDREWAKERWESLIARLRVGNVDTCWEIVQATWARRDAYLAESPSETKIDTDLGSEYTVRGRLHWLSVMEDQQWQVFVG